MPITATLPTSPVLIPTTPAPSPDDLGTAAILVPPLTSINPIQIVGLVPLSVVCCEAPHEYIRRMDVPIFIWSYTKNGVTTNVFTEFATLDEQDEFFLNLGWAHSDTWYYIITNDVWVWNLSYGVVPAIDEPVPSALPCPTECREWCESEFRIPVFGAGDDLYENDFNSWLVKIPQRSLTNAGTDTMFVLQRMDDDWTDLVVLNNNDYGTYYASFAGHSDYRGVGVDWGKVYFAFGSGCYRIKLRYTFISEGEEITVDTYTTPDLTSLPTGQIPVISFGMTLPDKGEVLQALNLNTTGGIETSLNDNGALQEKGVTVGVTKVGGGLEFAITARKANRVSEVISGASPRPNDTPLPPIWSTPATYGGSVTYTQDTLYYQCYASEVFELRGFDCELADDTVKFETWTKGKIGDKREDYLLFDLCGMWWYDSIRLYGLFGKYSVPEYKTVMLEWGNPEHGKQERVRDEAIQAFVFTTFPLPHWLQERLSVFMMMADEIRVSDYNIINPDWEIKRLRVVGDGGFEPKTLMDKGSRKTFVEVNFRRGVQGVIKSVCC